MSDSFNPIYIFEHPSFIDAHDAIRQSRLYGFRYCTDHTKYQTLCAALEKRVSAETLAEVLERPLDKIPDNTPLYILRLTSQGRDVLLPPLLEEALALGFSVFDDQQGLCYCQAGVWSVDGLRPTPGKA